MEDYAVVHELVADLVGEGVEATVPPTIRKTVETMKSLWKPGIPGSSVSVVELARELGLDKSAASRRVAAAIERGYLKNLEDHKGRPAQLILGEQLPDDQDVLPSPASLKDRCSVAPVSGGIETAMNPELPSEDALTPLQRVLPGKENGEIAAVARLDDSTASSLNDPSPEYWWWLKTKWLRHRRTGAEVHPILVALQDARGTSFMTVENVCEVLDARSG